MERIKLCYLASYEFDFNPWIIIYSLLSLGMAGASLVYFDRYIEEHSPLEAIYINSFNSLFMFLIADLVQVVLKFFF